MFGYDNLFKLGSSGFLGTIKSFIFYGLICLVLYFVAGIAYNMKVNGYQGFDAVKQFISY
jgi:hypothetical protein